MLKEENVFDTQMNRVSGQKNPYDLESPSQAKAREKKERNLATWSLIGDGIQAITKAVAASQGGKVNTNTPSMSKTYLERLEAQKAKRERQREKYNAYEERRNDTLGNLSIAKYRDARQREKETADAEWRQKNYDFEVQKYNEAKDWRQKNYDFEVQKYNDQKEHRDRQAKQSNALGWANYNLAKERNEEGFTVYDREGKPHKFRDKEAAKSHALQWGTYKLNTRKVMKPYQDEFGEIKYKEEEVVDGWYSVPKAKPTPQVKNGARYQAYGLPGMSLGTTPIPFNPNDEEEVIEYQ